MFKTNPLASAGNRSGEGADSLWPHLEELRRSAPPPRPPQAKPQADKPQGRAILHSVPCASSLPVYTASVRKP